MSIKPRPCKTTTRHPSSPPPISPTHGSDSVCITLYSHYCFGLASLMVQSNIVTCISMEAFTLVLTLCSRSTPDTFKRYFDQSESAIVNRPALLQSCSTLFLLPFQ
ncbi:hypothetical protein E2C01_059248 [Portunus trituberculatus]|uniref:Uncharacterized protein n=1 Tax=Portunus trituberculatus TaxID=210409 RepID=A0A5B7GYN0_PORTR|nr:hypothetical protein [Portunus trituberculatus]